MSKPSRLARPLSVNVTSKLPVSRIEDFNSRSRKISLGEKILRAGSEGSLVKKQQQVQTAQIPVKQRGPNISKGPTKNNMYGGSLDDAECHKSKENLSNGNSHTPSKAGRNLPRRHTVGGPRSSKEILGMQTSEMDRKREAFLEHLKYKYPHHATAIMGHQERLRDQAVQCMLASLHSELDIQRYLMKIESSQRTKSPKLSSSPQPSLGDPAEHLSEASADSGDAMFEGEATMPFVRGSRTRASLPVVRSTNQTKERSLGVLFLQYGEDTKKLQMPNEITSLDTIRALFVSAFPQQLTMKILESPSTAIYIKDEGRNIYYELSDVRNIQDRSFLKVYNKDPAHAFNHTPRAVNGDVRMQRDITYSVREGQPVHRPGSATYPSHGGPISPPPTPVPHSMPPSPSRIPYGGGRPPVGQSNATITRDRLSSLPASRSISPSPSAILERRDVKPDEDLGSKNVQLMRNDNMYAEPYLYHEGRMSVASSHGGHPLDIPDHLMAFHRGAMRSSSTYSNNSMQMEMMEQSVYRQKSRKHVESHLPTLGSKTPPASPHRMTDIRMMEMHGHNPHLPPHAIQSERSSPVRQSFKKDQGPGVFVEAKVRNTGGILGMADIVPSPTDKQVFGGFGVPAAPKDNYTRERMHAMEKQIASLTGLVQTALFKGPSPSSNKDAPGEKVLRSASSTPPVTDSPGHTVSSGKNSLATVETTAVFSQVPPAGSTDKQVSLHDMRRNVAELRLQLHKMRQLQLQNQEMVRAMMKKAELEISSKVMEMVKSLEDPVQRQRILVEQERQKYLQDEEHIVLKLSDLESFVEDMKKDSTSSSIVTLKDVEDRAFILRQIGEAVSNLKGEFPYLQNKMRAVLRVEVEAVRFLKEEPHKLDSLLKRIRNMTDALSTLRRHVSDGSSKVVDFNQNNQFIITEKVSETKVVLNKEEKSQTYLQTDAANAASSVKSEVVPLSAGVKVHQVQSSPVFMQQSQHSSALSNHLFNSSNQSADLPASTLPASAPTTAAQENTPSEHNGSNVQNLFIEEIYNVGYRNRAVSIEEAERKFEEKRQNIDHYNGKEFEKMLEEAQANIMKSIPSLEMPSQSLKLENTEKVEVSEIGQESEQDTDKLTKSPPPPPPRRMYSAWTSDWKDSKDSEDVPPPIPSKTTKSEAESPSLIKASIVKDEEEEEGERIMAELQAFQKCSIVEINSKVQYEPNKTEVHEKDFRPSGLALPKEKKVSCSVKEFVNDESPKLVENTENKWRMHFVQSSAPNMSIHRQEQTDVVNEQSTYSLFTGRDEPGSTTKEEPEKEIKNEKEENVHNYPNTQNLKLFGSTVPSEAIKERVEQNGEASHSTFVRVSNAEKVVENQDLSASKPSQEQGLPYLDLSQPVVLRQKNSRRMNSSQSKDVDSPTISPTEPKSPADNIAFMITNTEVQVLSTGEVQDIVNRKGGEVQTVNIDHENVEKVPLGGTSVSGTEDSVMSTDKKPVIIIFDEPMDIRSAYKRLSTIFEECDDELEKMMSEAKIEEEDEEEEEEEKESHVPPSENVRLEQPKTVSTTVTQNKYRFNYPSLAQMKQTMFQDGSSSQGLLTDEDKTDASDYQFGQRQDAKKKFKFKFPKKQLAALTQAIRTGTKTGKKTLQVVVYEDEEELDGTVKQHKEAKRFEIERSKSREENINTDVLSLEEPEQVSRTDEIRQNTYRTLDSLEQTIKQLESTISELAPRPGSDFIETKVENKSVQPMSVYAKEPTLMDDTQLILEPSSSIPTSARKGSNGASQTSRMPVPMSSKTRQGSTEKTSKQPKLQEPQRQFRQANGGTKKAGGDFKAASPTLSASKIPALSLNTGKSSSVSAQCNDTSNSHNPPVKSHVPITTSNTQSLRNINTSSLIRPVQNGTSKLQSPTYAGKGHHVSFSLQSANGRPSPPTATSSSPATPPSTSVSPTSLTQGMKSIRTIHTPSFTSYKSQNGSASKVTSPKETS